MRVGSGPCGVAISFGLGGDFGSAVACSEGVLVEVDVLRDLSVEGGVL